MKKSLILLLLLMPFLAIVVAGPGRVSYSDDNIIDDDSISFNDDIFDEYPIPGIHGSSTIRNPRRANATPNPHGVTFTPNSDVNYDGVVDVADIASVITAMTGAPSNLPQMGEASVADVNGDGIIDVADIASIITSMANGAVGRQAIDLGLPSGTLWANMNVGAERPEDYGLYFAWGETVGYTSDEVVDRIFDYESYKWMTPGMSWLTWYTKYQLNDSITDGVWYDADGNFIGDGKDELDPEDDAAHVLWGEKWEMPTLNQIVELINNTTAVWTTRNGAEGCLFTSKANGNAVFLPANGYRSGSYLIGDGLGGVYWTKSLLNKNASVRNSSRVRTLAFYTDTVMVKHNGRYNGFPVRSVLKKGVPYPF